MLDMLSAAAAQGAAPGWTGFLPIIGMVAIFWFLLIRPQMRQQKQHREKVAGYIDVGRREGLLTPR